MRVFAVIAVLAVLSGEYKVIKLQWYIKMTFDTVKKCGKEKLTKKILKVNY